MESCKTADEILLTIHLFGSTLTKDYIFFRILQHEISNFVTLTFCNQKFLSCMAFSVNEVVRVADYD